MKSKPTEYIMEKVGQEPSKLIIDENSQSVISHLAIVQAVIQRMAANSAGCKSWCITLVAAMFVLFAKEKPISAYIILIPIVVFAFLDAYYLALEKSFVKTYNDFIKKLHNSELVLDDLFSIKPPKEFNPFLFEALKSFSILAFYPPLIVLGVIVYYLIKQ